MAVTKKVSASIKGIHQFTRRLVFFDLGSHKLTGLFHFCQTKHIRQDVCQGFYRSVQITGCKSKAIGINIVGIRCSCFVFKNRNIHTHDILFSGFQINFLLGSHQCRIQRLLRHSCFCNDKIGVGASDTGFYFFFAAPYSPVPDPGTVSSARPAYPSEAYGHVLQSPASFSAS